MMKKLIKRVVLALGAIIIVLGLFTLIVNFHVKNSAEKHIVSPQEAAQKNADCIIVLGAGVWAEGVPSPMLSDRLERGIELYEMGAAPKLLMSGDHGTIEYDEVNVMKDFALDEGIPSEDVFMDHAGFSTYESMYRAAEIFGCEEVIVVTQEYHLYRAVYIGEKMGMTVWGVAAQPQNYANQDYRDAREILARVKDFLMVIFKPEPTYLGEAIPISGSGDVTNDR